jgi:molybdopterin converting factor subunit 1
MKIHIRYFASLREQVGRGEEAIEVHEGATIDEARAALLDRYPAIRPIVSRSVYAVNRAYMPIETILHEGDELVFIPPMGGGR